MRGADRQAGGTTYTFVTDGPEAAIQQARAAAGRQEICVPGGATIVQYYLNAWVMDELRLHLAPILLGTGFQLFILDRQPITLALRPDVADDAGVVHLRYGPT
jgi:dihydrofolate reductase